MSRDSDELFSHLAERYDEHFAVPHRKAYDELAWDLACARLPASPARVIDVGCGVGRWAERLIEMGHEVIGIEPAPLMADAAHRQVPRMRLLRTCVERAQLPAESADLIIAMGSMQYADEPERAMRNVARWLKPGGYVCLLVDSRVALAMELIAADRLEEALERLRTGRGRWVVGGRSAVMHLYDAEELDLALRRAGLDVVSIHGLLVGQTIWGRDALAERLKHDWAGQLRLERELTVQTALADLGKQLLGVARHPVPT